MSLSGATTEGSASKTPFERPLASHKKALIERAHAIHPFRTFADLGACWGVHGGYSFHAREVAGPAFERGFIVDQTITELTRDRAADAPGITLHQGMLGSDETLAAIGKVDVLIMFDILLHQVSPDWNEFLSRWARQTDLLIVYNQNWSKSAETVRFPDHDLDWFVSNVYHTDEDKVRAWYADHDRFDDGQRKPRRDVHNFWQWGITQPDLVTTCAELGFDLCYSERYGDYGPRFPWIKVDGMVFQRSPYR